MVADEAGIKSIDLRCGDNLCSPASCEWSHHMSDERCLQDPEVVGNGGPAHLTRPGIAAGLENSPTMDEQKFNEPLERVTPFEAEQLLDVLGPVGVHPLLKVALRHR